MKNLNIKKISICIVALLFVFSAMYFHMGFFYLVTEVIYSDDKIPIEHKNDLYYFMEEKLLFKNITALFLLILSVIFYFFNLRNDDKLIKGVLAIQLIIVFLSVLRWFLFQGFILG